MKVLVDDVQVAVPWYGRDPHREAALGWVARKWGEAGYAPTLGIPSTDPDAPWCKALAVRNAIGDSKSPIVVVADADVFSDGIHEAIARVRAGAPWAIPHHLLYRLSPKSTEAVLAGAEPYVGMELDPDEPTARRPGRLNEGYPGRPGGGIVVLRRDVYDDCPLDPRFIGWGHEDDAWALALNRLHGGPCRLGAPMWHLWHPPQQRLSRGFGSAESELLFRRYANARKNPDRMRALIDEGREVSNAHATGDRRDALDVGVSAP